MKKENAITLISLVITIIILIILAGITINILLGENGLLQKTKTATQEYKYQAVKEKVESEILALDIDKVTKGETLTIEQALIGVQEAGVFEEIDLESNTGICEGYVIELGYNENGKVVIKGIEKDTGTRIIAKLNPTGYTKNNVEVTILARTNGKNVTSIEVPEGMREKGSGVYEIEKNGTYLVKVSLEDGQILEKEITIATIDRLAPKDFEPTIEREGNKIIITPNGEDDEDEENVKSGIDYYEYYLNETKQESNEITGLTEGTYKVYVIAYDKAGNQKKSEGIEVEYTMKPPEITLSNEEWTNQNIIATVDWGETAPTDKKEISIDGGVTYTPYVNPVEIDRNTIIKAKLTSGATELIGEKEVTNIDKLAPNEFTPTVNDLESNTELIVYANATDQISDTENAQSGIDGYEYFVYQGDNLIDSSGRIKDTSWKASSLVVGETYQIKVDVYDKAQNKTSGETENYTKLPVYVWNVYKDDSTTKYSYSYTTISNMTVPTHIYYPTLETTSRITIDDYYSTETGYWTCTGESFYWTYDDTHQQYFMNIQGNGSTSTIGKKSRVLYYPLTFGSDTLTSKIRTFTSARKYTSTASTTHKKGDYTNKTVKSNNENAYPNNSYQGSYWYVKVQ